jgi:DNA-binding HxlR family transcriptional regulator
MAAMDLLGRRWSLRILWELRDGPVGARALRDRCDGMSTSVLYDRLRELGDAGLLSGTGRDGYALSAVGAALGRALQPLDAWADDWASAVSPRGDAR